MEVEYKPRYLWQLHKHATLAYTIDQPPLPHAWNATQNKAIALEMEMRPLNVVLDLAVLLVYETS